MWPKSIVFFTLVTHFLCRLPAVLALEPADLVGHAVIVVTDAAELKQDEKLLATIPRGETLRPDKSQGTLVRVEWEGDSGWLESQHVLPVQEAIDKLSRSIQMDPKTSGLYVTRGAAWREKKEFDISLADFNEAIRLDPGNALAYRGRALTWELKKEYEKAIADHTESLRLNDKSVGSYFARGWNRFQKKDYDQALADFNDALKIKPRYVRALMFRGYVWERQNDHDKAIADFSTAIQLESGVAGAHFSRGWNLFEKQEFEKALADFEEAIRLEPQNARAADYRRHCWGELGQFENVIKEYESALRTNPQDVLAHERLSRLRSTCSNPDVRNGKQAVELALTACGLTEYKSASVLDTLAAGYAEAGQFDRAMSWQKKALALANANSKKDFQARLDLYLNHQPLREDVGSRYPWEQFVSKDGRYRAQFPGTPQDRVDHPDKAFHEHQSAVKTANKLIFFAGYRDLPPGARKIDPQGEKTLKALLVSMAGNMKLISERKVPLGDHPGLEMQLESVKGDSYSSRGFLVGTRLYQLFVAGSSREMSRNSAAIARFLDSFALLNETSSESLTVPDGWQEIASEAGRFRVQFPDGKVEPATSPNDDSGLHEMRLSLPDGVKLAVGYKDLTAELQKQYLDDKQRLEVARDSMIARSGRKVVSERELKLLAFPGKELVLDDKDGTTTIVIRSYLVHNRVYQSTVVAPAARYTTDSETIRHFLQSFSLLSVASQDGELVLETIQPCYGPQGPVRHDRLYYPYDTIQFRARLRGVKLDEKGRPDLEVTTSLIDSTGSLAFSDKIRTQSVLSEADGGVAQLDIGVTLPPEPVPGDYSFAVNVKDLQSGREASFQRSIAIRPAELAIVSLGFFRDDDAKATAPAGGDVGQPFYVRLRAIGYERSMERMDTSMTLELFDEKGQQVLNPPLQLVATSRNAAEISKSPFVTFQAKLTIDRAGQFRLRISVQDRIVAKSTQLEVPVTMKARP